jgi:hypothetical protein
VESRPAKRPAGRRSRRHRRRADHSCRKPRNQPSKPHLVYSAFETSRRRH